MKSVLFAIYGFAFFLIILLAVDINFLWLFGSSPRISELRNPEINLTSYLYSSDGKQLATLYIENRTPVEYSDLQPHLINALIATEDIRFYKHHGIDVKAAFAAAWSTVRGDKRGGSTITQQLVKNLFKTRADYSTGLLGYVPVLSTMISKTKEWINALKIELYYSKEEILTMYFNTVDFGSHAFGINSASATFFGIKPSELNLQQSALLVGILKAPSYYSPVQNPKNALSRRNQVLSQMVKYNFLQPSAGDSLSDMPLALKYSRRGLSSSDASYLREAVARSLQNWMKETGYDVWTDGLKIYTTIDSKMQQYAEEAVAEHMKRLQKLFDQGGWNVVAPWIDEKGKEIPGFFLNAALELPAYSGLAGRYSGNMDSVRLVLSRKHPMKVFTYGGERDTSMSVLDSVKHYRKYFQTGIIAIEPETRHIKVWVGGINHQYFKFDHVSQSKRQPGSLFKGFVYAAAFDQGMGPCDRFEDKPVSIKYTENGEQKEWKPKNVDYTHLGTMTLKHAFARSVNSIAVQVAEKIGWQKVIEYAHKLGIRSKLENFPSICLGSSDVSLYEIVNAYCCFVNGGYLEEPVLVTRIEDKNGSVIYENKPVKKQVLSGETAYLMSIMLRSGLTEPGGTPQGLFGYDLFRRNTDFGGKTGTSSNYSDGWFIGVTPGLVAGCWVGNDDRSVHFKTSHIGEGLKTAMPVYGKFMEKVINDDSLKRYRLRFSPPSVKITKSYSCQTPSPVVDSTAISNDSLNDDLPAE